MIEFKIQYKELLERNFPAKLHSRIMKSVIYWKHRKMVMAGVLILIGNFLFSTWYLWAKILESDVIDVTQAMLQNLELDYDIIISSFQTIFEFVPIVSLIFFTCSLVAMIAAIRFTFRIKNSQRGSYLSGRHVFG